MFVTLSLEIPDKMKLHPLALEKLCYTPRNFQGQKPGLSWSPLEMPFLFLIDLWNCYIMLFQYNPKKFQVLNPLPYLEFFLEQFQFPCY